MNIKTKTHRGAVAGATALVAIAGLFFGGVLRDEAPSAKPVAPVGASLAADYGRDDIRTIVARLETEAHSADKLALLGLAYSQRSRDLGQSSDLTRAERAFRRALAAEPENLRALQGMGALALTRHRFAEALDWGRRAERVSSSTAATWGIIGDAQLELGRYRQAFASFDRMASLRPGIASYARVSYAREILGDEQGALEAMELALDAAGSPSARAWTYVRLGKLALSRGDLGLAFTHYRAALRERPDNSAALDALADAEAFAGRPERGRPLLERAIKLNPDPHYFAGLAGIYVQLGRDSLAKRAYADAHRAEARLARNGSLTALESAFLDADRNVGVAAALKKARRAHLARPSVDADDVLAWVLYKNDRCQEALAYSKRSLRLGSEDALKFFHRGMIASCVGDKAQARLWLKRALELNPYFALGQDKAARAELAKLKA